MSDRKLYSLSEREAAVLRARDPRWTDSAQRATPDPLTPIDRDAAIERMARALAFDYHGRDLWNDKAFGGTGLLINQDYYRRIARITFDALLEERSNETLTR